MPDTGAPYNLPYPALSDPANGPANLQALAEKVAAILADRDVTIGKKYDKTGGNITGNVSVSGSLSSGTLSSGNTTISGTLTTDNDQIVRRKDTNSGTINIDSDGSGYFRSRTKSGGTTQGQFVVASSGQVDIWAGGSAAGDTAQRIQITPAGVMQRYNYPDTRARPVAFAMQTGESSFDLPNTGAGGYYDKAVSFATGRFTDPPICTAMITSSPGGSAFLVPRIASVTTSGVTFRFFNTWTSSQSGTGISFTWLAVQMTPTTAVG